MVISLAHVLALSSLVLSTRVPIYRPIRCALQMTADEPPAVAESHLGRRTVGVDYGFRRTGVALSTGYSPQPLQVLATENNSTAAHAYLVGELMAIASRTGSVQFVVGMPLDQLGNEGNEQSAATRVFVRRLADVAQARGYHVYLWDERGSTMEARLRTQNAVLKRNRDLEHVDALAAAVILEDFFADDGKGAERLTETRAARPAVQGTAAAAPVPSYKEWQQQARERARRQREGK
jgi:putative Holliday junction resolvase